jgi:Fur family peroxide stress response transcriptional regulator
MKNSTSGPITRKTKQKNAILKVLRNTDIHPTANWIYKQVKQEIPNISLGTVYRDLKLLKQRGEIVELDYSGSLTRFDGNTSRHHHFRCQQCDRIFDIAEAVDSEIDNRVAAATGFDIFYHRLEFYGLCRDCRP